MSDHCMHNGFSAAEFGDRISKITLMTGPAKETENEGNAYAVSLDHFKENSAVLTKLHLCIYRNYFTTHTFDNFNMEIL